MAVFVIATKNQKKLVELERILAPLQMEAKTAEQLGFTLADVEETGTTFEENAALKAFAACRATGYPAIADDSGLMVDALDGAPGVYSARYAGEGATDREKYEKLLKNMEQVPAEKRTAHFVSAVCVAFPDGKSLTVRGECNGYIAFAPVGEGGFGYDPVFLTEDGRSFGQLTKAEKDSRSHRGNALRRLAKELPEFMKNEEQNYVNK